MSTTKPGLGATALRLATTEYLPLAGWITMWAVIAAAIRPADVARLLAATLLTRAVREFTAMDTAAGMRRRWTAAREVVRRSMRVAVRVELITLAVELLLFAALLAGVALLEPRAAPFLLILGAALPARHFAPANRGWRRVGLHRSALGWSGVLLVAAALMVGWGALGVAAALAGREWLALGLTLAPALRPSRPPLASQRPDPLRWREVAAITATRARTRLAFRVTKGILSIFGPIGSVLARTGRGFGAHGRLARAVPHSPTGAAALALASGGAAIGVVAVVLEPVTLALGAGLLRVAAAAGSAAVWSAYAGEDAPDEADGDDE